MPHASPSPRSERVSSLDERAFDVLVVGGGITGAGVALDLSARGLAVALVERGDWAGATSSASSRLVHGGLRYLERGELGLVREGSRERARLLVNAAGLVWPERFTFPIVRGSRLGRLRLAAGLALYSLAAWPHPLGFGRLVSRREVARRVPRLRSSSLVAAGSYLDGATHDARLTLAVVRTAIERGVVALSRMDVRGIERGAHGAKLHLFDELGGDELCVTARAVVLAGGPFTDRLRAMAGLAGRIVAPTRGAHVVVARARLPLDGSVIFESPLDGRVMFLLSWPRASVIGTTDLDADPGEEVRATRGEVRYLIDSVNALCNAALTESDVRSTWAGLRPLLSADEADPSARSREERMIFDGSIVTIAGGKLTGYRAMAEKLGAALCARLGKGSPSTRSPTRTLRLVGALELGVPRPRWSSLDAQGDPECSPEAVRDEWPGRYGAFAGDVEETCRRSEQGFRALDAATLSGEIDWAVRHEDCLTAEDFFLRRTNLAHGENGRDPSAQASVLERMGALLAWNEDRAAHERVRLEAALARLDRWRLDP